MKTFALALAVAMFALGLASCRTASWAAHGAADESEHAVEKTSHVLEHGARKVEKHL